MLGSKRIGAMLILGIAAVAAIGVPMNALFLQDGRHPAPLFAVRPSSAILVAPRPPMRPAAIEIERESGAPARPAPKDPIASKLAKLDAGLETGKVEPAKTDPTTGAADKTRDAIGMLILSKAPSAAGADRTERPTKTPSAEKPSSIDKSVLYAQRALVRLGYVVRADGVWNSATSHALEKFEHDAGLPAKGRITPKLLERLATLSGLPRR